MIKSRFKKWTTEGNFGN